MTLRARLVRLSAPTALLLASPHALGQALSLESSLNQEIVSTPSRRVETSALAPATSTIITAEDLRIHGLRSLDEAINFASLGMVTSDAEHAVEIGARGVLINGDYGNHVLLLIDGVPVNEAWNGTAYFERGAGVPFELIDRIEVTLGPGSVMYGGQAMLGIVHIVTRRARDAPRLRLILEGEATAPVGQGGALELSPLSAFGKGYRVGLGGAREFKLFGEEAEFTLQAELYRQDGPYFTLPIDVWGNDSVTGRRRDFGPRTPKGQWGGTVKDTSYVDAPAGYFRLRVGDLSATLRAGLYTRAVPYLSDLVNSGDDFDDADNHERDRWLTAALNYTPALSKTIALGARVHGQVHEYFWFARRSGAEQCPEGLLQGCERRLTGTGTTGGADLRVSFGFPETHMQIMTGVDGQVRRAESTFDIRDRATGRRNPPTNDYVASDALIAPYGEVSWGPATWLDLSAGLRADHDTRFGSAVSPRLGAGVTPWEHARLKLIYSEAFRSPTSYETNYADPNDQLAAPGLDAESVQGGEISFEQRFGPHRLLFGAFASTWNDLVASRILGADELREAERSGALVPSVAEAFVYTNAGSLKSYGYNVAYDGVSARVLRYGFTVTSAYSRIDLQDGSGLRAPTVGPLLFGNARASYDFGPELPTLGLALAYVHERPADRAFDGGFSVLPIAPANLRLRLTASGQAPALAGLSYRIGTTYSLASTGAYVVGLNQYASDDVTQARLSPLRRLSAFASLEYALE